MTTALVRKTRPSTMVCGFCSSGHHNLCPRAVRNGDGTPLPCACNEPYCGGQVLRCLDCKNEADGEIADSWRCIDRDACADTQRVRLDRNPHLRLVREVMKRVAETQAVEKAEKAKAEKKVKEPTYCVHGCGGETKGGKFLPGHDARYVAELVKAILDKDDPLTEDKALEKMGEQGLTEALQQKLQKSVKLANAEVEKAAAREAEKAKAAEAKAAEQAAAKAAKQEVADKPATPDSDASAEAPKAKKAAASQKA